MLRLSWLPGAYCLLEVSALGQNAAWVVGGAMYPPDRGIISCSADGGTTWRILRDWDSLVPESIPRPIPCRTVRSYRRVTNGPKKAGCDA